MGINDLSADAITAVLETRFVGQRTLYFPSLPTTIDAAKQEALKGAPEGTVIILTSSRPSALPMTVISRCQKIQFARLSEETIEEIVDALRREWETTSTIQHPIMVDENTRVVLDGTHRLDTLKRMGCTLIPACLVDYENPSIEVKSWIRIASSASDTMSDPPRDLADWGVSLIAQAL